MDRDSLRAAVDAGERFDYLLFYGHTPPRGQTITRSCLSQWYLAPFTVDGDEYPTAEHWMMAGKARLFRDDDALEAILSTDSPAAAKKWGRKVRNWDETTWKRNRSGIVTEGNVHKFGQNAALKDFLLATGDKVLVEAAPRDRIWGIGMGKNNPDATDPHAWRGLNLLGFALMAARERLRQA